MHQSLARYSATVSLVHAPSWADFITAMVGFKVFGTHSCPKEPSRKISRDIREHAQDVARSFAGTEVFEQPRREREKIEMRFAHLKRILRLGRLRLRGPRGAQDEFTLAAIAQNLRRLAKLVAAPPPLAAQLAP